MNTPAPATEASDAVPLWMIIAAMRNWADVADRCAVTEGHAPSCIRTWANELEALSAPAAAVGGGDDWVLVPREPTPEMLQALWKPLFVPWDAGKSYAAMIAAAPTAQPSAKDGVRGAIPGVVMHGEIDVQRDDGVWTERWDNGKFVSEIKDISAKPALNEIQRKAASPASPVATTVSGLVDDAKARVTDDVVASLVWKHMRKHGDLLTFDRSPPMFPQATYSVPVIELTNFVEAVIEAAIGREVGR